MPPTRAQDEGPDGPGRPIRLQVQKVAQLFHTLDPFPFRERDLDAGVEEYVVGWAGELPSHRPITIVVHLPAAEAQLESAGHVGEAIRNYFAYRADAVGWELRGLFRTGRISLAIGLLVLATCVIAGRFSEALFGAGYLGRFLGEGLIILGWVANWRPIEIVLYDWWPIARRRRLYQRLARARVEVIGDVDPSSQPQAPPVGGDGG